MRESGGVRPPEPVERNHTFNISRSFKNAYGCNLLARVRAASVMRGRSETGAQLAVLAA